MDAQQAIAEADERTIQPNVDEALPHQSIEDAIHAARRSMRLDEIAGAAPADDKPKAYGGLDPDFVDGVASKLNKPIDPGMSREHIIALAALADGAAIGSTAGISLDYLQAAYETGIGASLSSVALTDPNKSPMEILMEQIEEERRRQEKERLAMGEPSLGALAAGGLSVMSMAAAVMTLNPALAALAVAAGAGRSDRDDIKAKLDERREEDARESFGIDGPDARPERSFR